MRRRLVLLLALLALGSILGYWWIDHRIYMSVGGLLGVSLGAVVWLTWDVWGGRWVLRWVRKEDWTAAAPTTGFWGDMVESMQRWARRLEMTALASERRLDDYLSAMQSSPNGVVLLNEQAQIQWCNLAAAQQLGIDPQRDLMQRIGNLLRTPVFLTYMETQDARQPVVIEGYHHSIEHPVLIELQRHPYGQGRQMLLTREVSAQRKAEAMRRNFVANVSHEIRTPLTVLAGFVETLQSVGVSEQERQRYLALMSTQAQRMNNLVADLLTLSRLESAAFPGYANALPLVQLMGNCQQEAQRLSLQVVAGRAAHTLIFSAAPNMQSAQLLGDANQLQSALSNLVSNAVRYTPPGGTIAVRASRAPEGGLQLEVRDTGAGIAAEHIPRLTERFYRVDHSRSRESGGTGLGLAIVKHVMQLHNGKLSISSTPGEGSVFTLWLPEARVRF